MTTQEFIEKNIGYNHNTTKQCSSVFVDTNGIVYSYGYHYPLAAIVNGKGFVNTRGYSVTTAKHISWAYQALAGRLGSHNVYGLELSMGFIPVNMLADLHTTQRRITELLLKKKRKNTRVYQDLAYRLEQTLNTRSVVRNIINEQVLQEQMQP